MTKLGRALEQLVSRIEKAIAGSENVTVTSPKRLVDRTTGRLREHDVVLVVKQAHHSFQLSIECRDRSRPVGVPQIEAFWKKCQDTGIDQGVIVSPKGFHKTAKNKAKHLGIRCLTLSEALSFNWLPTPQLHVERVEQGHKHFTFVLEDEQFHEVLQDYKLIDSQGNEVTQEFLSANVTEQLILAREQPNYVDTGQARFLFDGKGYFIKDNRTGTVHPLKQIIADVDYQVVTELAPFALFRYSEEDIAEQIGDAAVAKVHLGNASLDLMFLQQPTKGMSLSISSDDSKFTITEFKELDSA